MTLLYSGGQAHYCGIGEIYEGTDATGLRNPPPAEFIDRPKILAELCRQQEAGRMLGDPRRLLPWRHRPPSCRIWCRSRRSTGNRFWTGYGSDGDPHPKAARNTEICHWRLFYSTIRSGTRAINAFLENHCSARLNQRHASRRSGRRA
jgi:hypothetical protein